jgi:hypothetical protein
MQVVEVRSRIQRALGRPFPLEEVGHLHFPGKGQLLDVTMRDNIPEGC